MFLGEEGGGEVGVEEEFVVGDFGEFLYDFYEVVIFDVYPSAVGDEDEGGVELPDLVQQKIFQHEPHEIAFMVLDVFLVGEDVFELLGQDA